MGGEERWNGTGHRKDGDGDVISHSERGGRAVYKRQRNHQWGRKT